MRSILQLAVPTSNRWLTIFLSGLLGVFSTTIYADPSVPYMPSWQARNSLERLVDEAGLQITTTHWPLPSAAVQHALDDLPNDLSPSLMASKEFIANELEEGQGLGRVDAQLRSKAEAPVGFGQNYTPGSSIRLSSAATEFGSEKISVAAKAGIRVEESPNSLQTSFSGWGKDGRVQAKLDDTALVTQIFGLNVQAFAHQNWWGPGWQSSLINGDNAPPWMGVGVQRSEVTPSKSRWLSWMGPWTFEMFMAQTQDAVLAANLPGRTYLMGSRLTLKPWSWMEIGLTRDEQMTGTLHQMLLTTFAVGNTQGSQQDVNGQSNGVAGYDVRLNCPRGMRCTSYFQWMGEDASGQSHLPNQFMTLGGVEWWSTSGRHRVFAEFMETYTHSFPWNDYHYVGSGYRNGSFPQGFTNGARWIGSSFGGDARILAFGWLDAEASRLVKFYIGETSTALGSYDPNTTSTGNLIGPHGSLVGVDAQQGFKWRAWTITPELAYTHLAYGISIGVNRTTDIRASVAFSRPLGN